ncbi:Serine/threonine-protein kinase Nek4 [Bulinus truncatus]|nr:Serine/threonine-protein kinase Nek4 [Bulinus truncatus]
MALDDFDRIKIIGKGSYGEVWLAKHKKDKKQYVLKKMNLGKASKRERKSAEQEAKLLSTLKHPNIVSYKDSFETDSGFLYIAMQYCEGGDLYARLKEQHSVPLEERQVVEWFVQIAMALQYMHERHILHRDLKTQNIFLTKNKIIKVGDLGIARVLENAGDMATTLIGTPYYMSPELFSNKPYNDKSDVWALGCCVYEMTTLKHAFNAKDMNSLVYKILKGKMPPMPRQYSDDLLSLMKSMLHQNPDKRPTVNRILRDPYIKKNIALFLEDTKKNARRSSSSQANNKSETQSSSVSSASSRKLPTSASANDIIKQNLKEVHSNEVQKESKSQDQKMLSVNAEDSGPRQRKPLPTPKAAISSGLPVLHDSKSSVTSQCLPNESNNLSSKESVSQNKNWSSSKESVSQNKHCSSSKESVSQNKHLSSSEESVSQNKHWSSSEESVSQNKHWSSSKDSVSESRSLLSSKESVNQSRNLSSSKDGVIHKRNVSSTKDSVSESRSLMSSKDSVSESRSLMSSKDSVSQSFEEETPKINLSARQRRRQQKNEHVAESSESVSIKLRHPPQRTESERVTSSEKKQLAISEMKSSLHREPSFNESSSSSDDTLRSAPELPQEDKAPNVPVSKDSKEMNKFLTVLNTTLQKISVDHDSDEEIPSVQNHDEDKQSIRKSLSMPSVETLTNTSRLMSRIKMLHKDCIKGVGYTVLKKAYEILDRIDEDEVEPKLVDLLGKESFDEYAGKIWQLKFCEESLFMG